MVEKIIYGKPIADHVNEETHHFNKECMRLGKRKAKVVAILLGDSQASLSYIAGFERLCKQVEMEYEVIARSETISQSELISLIHQCNEDPSIDGILLQMPLPKKIDSEQVLLSIDPDKGVDGFHPMNVGRLWMGQSTLAPCTALSVMKFIEASQIDLCGKHVVILGRSNIVGKPLASLCLGEHATVTMCHSKTKNIEEIASSADVLIAAIGRAKMIKSNWVKEGAVVLDVGVNRDEEGKLCGDVDLDDCIAKVAKISPVPKGIGVVTNAMLLSNTIKAYQRREK